MQHAPGRKRTHTNDSIPTAHQLHTDWLHPTGVLEALGARSTIRIEHIEPNMTHEVIREGFAQMVEFVRAN